MTKDQETIKRYKEALEEIVKGKQESPSPHNLTAEGARMIACEALKDSPPSVAKTDEEKGKSHTQSQEDTQANLKAFEEWWQAQPETSQQLILIRRSWLAACDYRQKEYDEVVRLLKIENDLVKDLRVKLAESRVEFYELRDKMAVPAVGVEAEKEEEEKCHVESPKSNSEYLQAHEAWETWCKDQGQNRNDAKNALHFFAGYGRRSPPPHPIAPPQGLGATAEEKMEGGWLKKQLRNINEFEEASKKVNYMVGKSPTPSPNKPVEDLKPCPFCGLHDLDTRRNQTGNCNDVLCENCGAFAETQAKWNRRTSHATSSCGSESASSPDHHSGDCTIYASLINKQPSDGICTCGYGLSQMGKGQGDIYMYSVERKSTPPTPSSPPPPSVGETLEQGMGEHDVPPAHKPN